MDLSILTRSLENSPIKDIAKNRGVFVGHHQRRPREAEITNSRLLLDPISRCKNMIRPSQKKNYGAPLSESDSCVPKTHDSVQKILARRERIFHARLNASFSCLILYSNIFPKPHTYTLRQKKKKKKQLV